MHEVNAIVLLDEKDARNLAEKLGLEVMGTVGLLIWAKKMGYVESLREELDRLIDSGFWLGRDVYRRALNIANEFKT